MLEILKAIIKGVAGFLLLSAATYGAVIAFQNKSFLGVILFLFVALFGFIVIQTAIDHKSIRRRQFFETQLSFTRNYRSKIGVPHYGQSNYQEYLASANWRALSKCAIQAMNGKCEFCGNTANAVHHVCYPNDRKNLGLENIASLCVVCNRCHESLHGKYDSENGQCVLCRKKIGKKKLHVEVRHGTKVNAMVCKRCNALATGFREEAYEWSWDKYLGWIANWEKSVFTELAQHPPQPKSSSPHSQNIRTYKSPRPLEKKNDLAVTKAQQNSQETIKPALINEVLARTVNSNVASPEFLTIDVDAEYNYNLIKQITNKEAKTLCAASTLWPQFLSKVKDGDEFWRYSASLVIPTDMLTVIYRRVGVAIVRNKLVQYALTTESYHELSD